LQVEPLEDETIFHWPVNPALTGAGTAAFTKAAEALAGSNPTVVVVCSVVIVEPSALTVVVPVVFVWLIGEDAGFRVCTATGAGVE
jgi:hypothetical protein